MMFDVIKFEAEHIKEMVKEPMNAHLSDWYESGRAKFLQENTEGFSVVINEVPVLCGGIVPLWVGRGYLWTVLSDKIKNHSITVYRGLKKALLEQPYRRIEMDVPVDFELAHRRARFLGFTLECARAKGYLPDGSDRALYAWVRT